MTSPLFSGHKWRLPFALLALGTVAHAETVRQQVTLESGWRTALAAKGEVFSSSYLAPDFYDGDWRAVSVPHNWESYEGYRQLKHGNLHGTAWYRLGFDMPALAPGERAFLYFEGVGSYATIWVNGQEAGHHAGGLTTFTIDITSHSQPGQSNLLTVRADHPAGIRDLPWVCGGCELAYGFSEGTQPFGIFRPVHLVITNSIRVTPFGVHVWNGQDISAKEATLHINTEVRNHGASGRKVLVRTTLQEQCGDPVFAMEQDLLIGPSQIGIVEQQSPAVQHPRLWSMEDPYLYRVVTELIEDGEVIDQVETPYGIRWIEWPDPHGSPGKPLLLNGEPVFINGVADYEHQLGASHAFTNEQVTARASQIRAAGFNAFRDAHHPHNLRFNEEWDQKGLLWWTQFGAHIWFESQDFQENYKALLRDWIRERRNSPSLFLYGLQNESKLPADFASECVEIIREMDPTASTQRPVVTCNGGMGTDWDVPQNWSGTYGGNLLEYGNELRQHRMVGEYGAWRSLDFHSEGGFIEDGPLTEDRMAALMETKVRLAETVRDAAVGHFAWPFTTHQNPGR
ncbi:MAG TPA: glycoside hydrolase family 2 TIM barrel-domain containing protein, partial [Oceanipulchritudo sp.]|nr:glycoside hydrolase family 2 TIM barrel-domain containing protein [Oceanipulchritudo sp.]